MDGGDKKALSEIDICDLFITPAIKNVGWDPMKQVRREVTLAPARLSSAALCLPATRMKRSRRPQRNTTSEKSRCHSRIKIS